MTSTGVFFEEVSQGVKGWWVRSPGASDDSDILSLHGGAYTLGTAKAYRGFASQLVGLALATLGETIADSPAVAAAVVFSPWTDLALTGALFNDPQICDPIFQPGVVAAAAKAYLNGHDPRDGWASPLYRVTDVTPPLAIQAGTDELLLDDATRYGAFAAHKGGDVRLDIFQGITMSSSGARSNYRVPALLFDNAAHFLSRHQNRNKE